MRACYSGGVDGKAPGGEPVDLSAGIDLPAARQVLVRLPGLPLIKELGKHGVALKDFFTTTIAPGVYDFRLIAVDRSGNYPPPGEIRLTVQR